jgi:hypothetical protein
MPVAGPIYFAWADANEAFSELVHLRMDEYVFSIKRTLSENQKPMLELEIERPHVGLLSPGRKYWAWLAWDSGSGIVPLFFGRLVGNPVQLFQNTITIQLIADPTDYKHQIQMIAESLKVLPYWAEEWVEVTQRDNPDKILETRAAFWDVDPVTHEVLMVSITEGPSGNVVMSDHFFDGVSTTVGQTPAKAILMDATVSWLQTAHGVVDVGNHTVTSYSDSIISEMPKPLTQLGGGYSVFTSDAYDVAGAAEATSVTVSSSWQNKEKVHNDGDTMSSNLSQTIPIGPIGISVVLTENNVTGLVDPFSVDADGDPSPTNLPASHSRTTAHACYYTVKTSLVLEYRAERRRTERVVFTIGADTQPILVDPDIDQESEIITMPAVDVGAPLFSFLNRTTVAGTFVSVGQVIFPDDPQIPSERTAQIVTVAGTILDGPQPEYSDVPGDTTVDGTATLVSLGAAQPPSNSQDWRFGAPINPGTIILPLRPFYVPYAVLVAAGHHQFPARGTSVTEGLVVQAPDGSFQVCTASGTTTAGFTPAFSATWGTVVTDFEVEWTSLGTALPSGSTFFIAIQAAPATTGGQLVVPPFGVHEGLHDRVTDGGVVWQSIGSGEIPIGGTPGNVSAPSFFTTARGHQSLEYLSLLVRAKHLWRARCVDVTFETDWATGHTITTRHTVTLEDPRVPGGIAFGKVKSAELLLSDTGGALCRVTISCLVGNDNAVEEVEGDPEYADDDYCDPDYQFYSGQIVLLPTGSDLTYEPPVYRTTDDGLTFPLSSSQIVLVDAVRDDGTQSGAVAGALQSMRFASNIVGGGSVDSLYSAALARQIAGANSISQALQDHPVFIEYQFRPLNGTFNAVYHVKFSDLTMARGVDLQSEVST